MSRAVVLAKPITVGDIETAILDLREPTVDDVADLGYPFLVMQTDNGTAVQIQARVVLKYVSRLAAVPPSSLKGLALSDLSELNTVVMGFFGDAAETSLS